MIRRLKQAGTAVLYISHRLNEVKAIADRVTVLNHGEVVFEGSPDEARSSALLRDIYLGGWVNG